MTTKTFERLINLEKNGFKIEFAGSLHYKITTPHIVQNANLIIYTDGDTYLTDHGKTYFNCARIKDTDIVQKVVDEFCGAHFNNTGGRKLTMKVDDKLGISFEIALHSFIQIILEVYCINQYFKGDK